jgi:polyisoprenoid-binding protein YceI
VAVPGLRRARPIARRSLADDRCVMSTQTTTASPAIVGTWTIDPDHSSAEFQIKHLGLMTVKGFFERFGGTIVIAEHLADSHLNGAAEVASLTTRVEARDEHLRSADFFDADNHPDITFASTRVSGTPEHLVITGDLTIRGMTREVVIDAAILGAAVDGDGRERLGMAGQAEIDRRDFGLEWEYIVPSGAALVARRARLVFEISAVR